MLNVHAEGEGLERVLRRYNEMQPRQMCYRGANQSDAIRLLPPPSPALHTDHECLICV